MDAAGHPSGTCLVLCLHVQTGRRPADYALIDRQQVARLEPQLAQAFAKFDLRVRNDDAKVGEITLQDLLTDELVGVLMGVLALAVSKGGQPQVWRDVTSSLARVYSGRTNREVGTQVEDDLTDYLGSLRAWLALNPLGDSSGIDLSDDLTDALTSQLTGFVRVEAAGHKRLFGDRPADLEVTLDAFRIRFAEAIQRSGSWAAVVTAFFDEDAVPLLTIHRSKGLE